TRTEGSADREPNQGGDKGDESPKRHLSDQELQQAIDHLKQLAGVKENNLTVRLVRENDIVLVFIEDPTGKIIRRIPEAELSTLTKVTKIKGNIIAKAS